MQHSKQDLMGRKFAYLKSQFKNLQNVSSQNGIKRKMSLFLKQDWIKPVLKTKSVDFEMNTF